jgi:hypothetical protein
VASQLGTPALEAKSAPAGRPPAPAPAADRPLASRMLDRLKGFVKG